MNQADFVRVAALGDLPDGAARCVQVGDRRIALFRIGADEVCAIDNVCPHQGGPLADGLFEPEEGLVTCPLHAWDFDVRTGHRLGGPEAVRVFAVRVVDGAIEVAVDPDGTS